MAALFAVACAWDFGRRYVAYCERRQTQSEDFALLAADVAKNAKAIEALSNQLLAHGNLIGVQISEIKTRIPRPLEKRPAPWSREM